jgi:uncharacterized protein (DUF2141 family)
MTRPTLSFALLLFLSNIVTAQTITYNELLTATVEHNGESILNPFCGGMNSTQLSHADLNNDGKNDLTVYDFNTETLKTFINIGQAGEAFYEYQPRYAKNFPKISSFLKLVDYNCDNVPDLIQKGNSGFSVYYGSYTASNELSFTFYKNLFYPGAFGPVNAYTQPNDIPIVEDLDGDGDLDFAAFGVWGTYCEFYKNLQKEENLPCDSIKIVQGDPCWGKMYQVFVREHITNITCKGGRSQKKQRHSGNCILAIDINGDGLQDMLGGNVSFSDLQLLINTGTPANAEFTIQDTLFDADNHQIELNSWPSPFYFDYDNDGIKDLVITPHTDNSSSANYNAMAMYKNVGTTAAPNFQWTNDSLFVDQMIDVGRNSHPTLFDFDKDGKDDLFIGGAGIFNTVTKTTQSRITYYRNTSTLGNISFELITEDFLNLTTQNYTGLYPTFGDVTGDGIYDLIMGNDEGKLIVYQNTANSNSVPPVFMYLTNNFQNIDVGKYSFPVMYDANNDGKKDLLIGCEIGTQWLFEDTSTNAGEYKFIDSAIGGIKSGGAFTFFSYGVPYVGRVDSSNKEYLLIGTADGTIERYDSFTNNQATWVRIDSMMGDIQTAYRAAPAVGDLDGDQRPELLIGNQNGGLRLFQFDRNNNNTSVSTKNIVKNKVDMTLYPNPTGNMLWIQTPNQEEVSGYRILDISGRTILQKRSVKTSVKNVSTEALTSGLYFIEVSFKNDRFAKGKFMKK